jgi:hypothetical protein
MALSFRNRGALSGYVAPHVKPFFLRGSEKIGGASKGEKNLFYVKVLLTLPGPNFKR